jgi:hypothetical protein
MTDPVQAAYADAAAICMKNRDKAYREGRGDFIAHEIDYAAILARAAEVAAAPAPDLSDPNTVHLNMLRGTIAKPAVEQIIHIYGIDALCKALAPHIVREAEAPQAPWTPPPEADRPEGYECLGLNPYGYWRHIRWGSWRKVYAWRTKPDDLPIQPTAFATLPPAPARDATP